MTDTDALRDLLEKILAGHCLQYTLDVDGNGLRLVDALSCGPTIKEGKQEIELLADRLARNLVKQMRKDHLHA